MKLISLNIWGGKVYEPLIKFVKESAPSTDIFYFQEVFFSKSGIKESHGTRVNILEDLAAVLPDFRSFVAPTASGYDNAGPVDFDITEAKVVFLKKNPAYLATADGNVFTSGNYRRLSRNEKMENVPTNFQYLRLSANGKKFAILNVHGVSRPGDKLDTSERLAQSQKIVDFLRGEDGAKIICGDFNLLPQTKSIAMIENAGMINLIKKFNIELTRSRLSPFFGKPDFQKFADYAFVSRDVNVINFTVPDIPVSDHLPLVLEFS